MIKLPCKYESVHNRCHQPGAVLLHGCFFNGHPVQEWLEKPDFQVMIGIGVEVMRHGMEDYNYVRGLEPSIIVDKFKTHPASRARLSASDWWCTFASCLFDEWNCARWLPATWKTMMQMKQLGSFYRALQLLSAKVSSQAESRSRNASARRRCDPKSPICWQLDASKFEKSHSRRR